MREPALRALRAWLADPQAPRLCVVTGSPGTGKSRLLADLFAAEPASFNAGLSARGMTAAVVEWALAEQLALPPDGLVARLTADTRPATLLIGEFDESGPSLDGSACSAIIETLLGPLLALGHVRLLVEGRPGAVDGFEAESTVLNLDAPAATDRDVFGARMPDEAFPNIGIGLLGGATAEQWLNAQPEETLPGLYSLGFAAAPLDRETWLTLCAVLTGDHAAAQESVSATAPVVARGDGTFALSSRTLRAAGRRRATPDSSQAIAEALLGTVPRRPDGRLDWTAASTYVLRHLLHHNMTSVLADPGFLLAGEPIAITSAFADAGPEPLRRAWLFAAPSLVAGAEPAERATLLRLAALHQGDEATAELFAGNQAEWEVVSADTGPDDAPDGTPEPGWAGPVTALASGHGPHDGQVLTAGADGQIRVLSGPTPTGRLVTGPHDVAAIAVADDGAALVLDTSSGLHVRRPESTAASSADRLDTLLNAGPARPTDSAALIAAIERHGAELTALGAADGLLLTGDRTGEVRAWPNGASPSSARLHDGPVTAVACVRTRPDMHAVISGGADGAVRLWGVGQEPMASPVEQRETPVSAIAAGRLSTGPAFVAAWADGLIIIWDLKSGLPDTLRLGYAVHSVALGTDGTLVIGGRHGTATIRFHPRIAWPDIDQAQAD